MKGWKEIIDYFLEQTRKIKEEFDMYDRIISVDYKIQIKYGCLRIKWKNIEIKNYKGHLLFSQTKLLKEKLKKLSNDIEKWSLTVCSMCSAKDAELIVDSLGSYQVLCNSCKMEVNPYL